MLTRSFELQETYEEIYQSFANRPRALVAFFDVFVHTPVAWDPEKIQEARSARKALIDVNEQIAMVANELAHLLARRDELKERTSFSCDTYYHILDVVGDASEHNYLLESYVKAELNTLQYQYDLKYWPSLSSAVEAIGFNAVCPAKLWGNVKHDNGRSCGCGPTRPGYAMRALRRLRGGVSGLMGSAQRYSLCTFQSSGLKNCPCPASGPTAAHWRAR
ncbi:hypothetical protein [Pseudomonas sp. NKUCC02_KPG]|uniref:hypothetical protein n=1 Tax=Pseudomonas sp. NKUCC02_KPG TaxID=2842124 RepID=UPI001C5BD913|nr:hypothetical protein [Pseudomonas sp. NKUCC02_KPG]MBW3504677.1 hypothetical protein [Pseudomonas sp. NKUCC02_KPG]